MNLATNLRRLRLLHALTQGQVADILQLNRSTYQAYEEGRAQPSIETFLEICELFHVKPREMVSGKPIPPIDQKKLIAQLKSHIEQCYQLLNRS